MDRPSLQLLSLLPFAELEQRLQAAVAYGRHLVAEAEWAARIHVMRQTVAELEGIHEQLLRLDVERAEVVAGMIAELQAEISEPPPAKPAEEEPTTAHGDGDVAEPASRSSDAGSAAEEPPAAAVAEGVADDQDEELDYQPAEAAPERERDARPRTRAEAESTIIAAELSFEQPSPWRRGYEQLVEEVAAIERQAQQLLREGLDDLDELRWRITEMANRLQLLTAHNKEIVDASLDGAVRSTFGCMSSVCRRWLNPRKIYVDGLRDDTSTDAAEAQHMEALRELDRLFAKRDELERGLKRQAEARRLLDGVLAHAEAEADELFVERVRTYLGVSQTASDERFLQAVAPREHLFATSSDFRALRRQLARLRGETATASASDRHTVALGADVPARRETAADAAEDGRGGDAGSATATDTEISSDGDNDSDDGTLEHSDVAAYRGAFRGQRALILGGVRRPEREEAIRDFFGFAELEWLESTESRRVANDRVERRIASGSIHLVLHLLRWTSHGLQDTAKAACKQHGVPYLGVERGYGIARICHTMRQRGLFPPAASPVAEGTQH